MTGVLLRGENNWRLRAVALLAASLFPLAAQAQFVPPYVGITGKIASANGMPAANYALTFTPTQVMFVGGTGMVVNPADCATDTNGGVIGLSNPLTGAVVSMSSGTLPAGNYQVEITWYDTYSNQTLPSPPVNAPLTSPGAIVVSPPASGAPAQAIGMRVYISVNGGAFAFQGQTTTQTASFIQSAALAAGAAPPIFNSTVCQLIANDAAWPIAGYVGTVIDASGNTLPGFPKQMQFVGPGSAYNLSNGMPVWNGSVIYPVPILTVPFNHNAQSISGSLSLTGYNLFNVGRVGVGTAIPGFGVDVQGTGVAGTVNAAQGYQVNGAAGTAGQALCSDGTYFDALCTFLQGPVFYQSVITGTTAGSALTQRSYLGVGSGTGLTAVDVIGLGPNVSRTVLNVNSPGTSKDLIATYTVNPGSSTALVKFDGNGNMEASAGGNIPANAVCNSNGCYILYSDGTLDEWGISPAAVLACSNVCGEATVTFPHAFASTTNLSPVTGTNLCAQTPCGSGVHPITTNPEAYTLTTSGVTIYFDAGGQTISTTPQAWWHAKGK